MIVKHPLYGILAQYLVSLSLYRLGIHPSILSCISQRHRTCQSTRMRPLPHRYTAGKRRIYDHARDGDLNRRKIKERFLSTSFLKRMENLFGLNKVKQHYKANRYPILRMQNFPYLKKKIFSRIDLNRAHHNAESPEVEKTAIITLFGVFEFSASDFRVARFLAQSFQRFMNHTVLEELNFLNVYIEDIIICKRRDGIKTNNSSGGLWVWSFFIGCI